MTNSVRYDIIVTRIGSRVQDKLKFGQNHKQSPYFWSIFVPFIGIELPEIYCYMPTSIKCIDITTSYKILQGRFNKISKYLTSFFHRLPLTRG